jgi:hypothetical protein
MPRKRKVNVANLLDYDREADADFLRDTSDDARAHVLLKPVDLGKRWGVTADAIRKMRERGTGPPFICLNRRRILYRLLDVINYEANHVAYSRAEARSIGLL